MHNESERERENGGERGRVGHSCVQEDGENVSSRFQILFFVSFFSGFCFGVRVRSGVKILLYCIPIIPVGCISIGQDPPCSIVQRSALSNPIKGDEGIRDETLQ